MFVQELISKTVMDIGNSLVDLLIAVMVIVVVFLIYNAIMAVVQSKQNQKGYSAFFID